MKVAPRVHRKQSDPFCDQPAILEDGRRAKRPVDCNAVAGKGVDFCLHWVDGPAKNHYFFIWTGKRDRFGREIRRALTKDELHKPVREWDPALVLRWRKTLSPVTPKGKRETKAQKRIRAHRPRTVAEMAKIARRKRVTIGWELKSPEYGTVPALAARFKKQATVTGGQFFVMTLASMAQWRGKMKNFHAVGVPTLILTHGARPADWAVQRQYVTYRGAWR